MSSDTDILCLLLKDLQAKEICAGAASMNRDSGVDCTHVYKNLLSHDKLHHELRDISDVSSISQSIIPSDESSAIDLKSHGNFQ